MRPYFQNSFLLGRLGREVHNWKSHSDFLFLKNLFFWNIIVTCDETIKVLSSQNVLLWIFLEIRYLIWRYAKLNRLLVGSGQNPLNIELKQDDYTVCCIHSVVRGYSLKYVPSTFFFCNLCQNSCYDMAFLLFLVTFRLHMTKILSVKLKKKFSAHSKDFINLGVPPW